MRLRTRFSLAFIGNTILVLSLFGGTYYVFVRRSIIMAQRKDQAKTAAKLASVCGEMNLAANAIIGLNYIHVVKEDPSVAFAACLDPNGVVQVHSDTRWFGRKVQESENLQGLQADASFRRLRKDPGGTPILEWYAPVIVRGEKVGWASIGYDKKALDDEIRSKLWETMRQPLIAAACTFLSAVFIGLLLAWSLSRPIGGLVKVAHAIGEGDLDYRTSIVDRDDELGYLAKEMDSMARKLKELDELKDEFIQDVSHDLRSPMASISMYLEYVLAGDKNKEDLQPRHRQMLTVVMQNAVRLNVFVSNILDAAKMKAGRMEYHLQSVDLSPLALNLEALYGAMAAQKNISLKAELPSSLPPLHCDPERLEQILSNLTSNALKFTPPGGEIRIIAGESGDKVEVCVSDTGSGIPKEDLPKLFQRFYQSDLAAQRSRRVRGTGLGLAIVKRTVEAMGGEISVESEPGRGTRFFLRLPKESAEGGGHGDERA